MEEAKGFEELLNEKMLHYRMPLIINYQHKDVLINALKKISYESVKAFKSDKAQRVFLLVSATDEDAQKILNLNIEGMSKKTLLNVRRRMFSSYIDAKALCATLDLVGKVAIRGADEAMHFLEEVKNLKPEISQQEFIDMSISFLESKDISDAIYKHVGDVVVQALLTDIDPLNTELQRELNLKLYNAQCNFKFGYAIETDELKHRGTYEGGFLQRVHDIWMVDMDYAMWEQAHPEFDEQEPVKGIKAWEIEQRQITTEIRKRKGVEVRGDEIYIVPNASKGQTSIHKFESKS